jgi:hypothetical protein
MHARGPMTASQIIDMRCRICDESVWREVDGHSHAWDAVAQVIDHYDLPLFQDIHNEITSRGLAPPC